MTAFKEGSCQTYPKQHLMETLADDEQFQTAREEFLLQHEEQQQRSLRRTAAQNAMAAQIRERSREFEAMIRANSGKVAQAMAVQEAREQLERQGRLRAQSESNLYETAHSPLRQGVSELGGAASITQSIELIPQETTPRQMQIQQRYSPRRHSQPPSQTSHSARSPIRKLDFSVDAQSQTRPAAEDTLPTTPDLFARAGPIDSPSQQSLLKYGSPCELDPTNPMYRETSRTAEERQAEIDTWREHERRRMERDQQPIFSCS